MEHDLVRVGRGAKVRIVGRRDPSDELLAERVGENRIVAAIHYQCDHDARKAVAIECFRGIVGVDAI